MKRKGGSSGRSRYARKKRHISPTEKPIQPHAKKEQSRGRIGLLKGKIEIRGDIISPIDVEWDAVKGKLL